MKPDISEKEKKVYVTLYKKDAPSYAVTLPGHPVGICVCGEYSGRDAGYLYDGRCGDREHFPLFLLFTCAVKVNVYEIPWAAVSLIVGGYMLLRQFVLVPFVLQPYDREQNDPGRQPSGSGFVVCCWWQQPARKPNDAGCQKQLAHPNQ